MRMWLRGSAQMASAGGVNDHYWVIFNPSLMSGLPEVIRRVPDGGVGAAPNAAVACPGQSPSRRDGPSTNLHPLTTGRSPLKRYGWSRTSLSKARSTFQPRPGLATHPTTPSPEPSIHTGATCVHCRVVSQEVV